LFGWRESKWPTGRTLALEGSPVPPERNRKLAENRQPSVFAWQSRGEVKTGFMRESRLTAIYL